MPTGPPDQSPPVEADFGPSHDAITAELLDLTWQFLTHASPTVRAELGQFLAGHGQHPVAGLGAFLECLQLSAARHHPRDAHGERTPPRSTTRPKLAPATRVRTAQVGLNSFPPGARSRSRNQRVEPTGVSGIATLFRKQAYLRLTAVGRAARAS